MVIKTRNGRKTQTWYFDQKSLTIKTRNNNQSWDIKNAGKTNNMQVWSTNSGWFQIFKFEAIESEKEDKDDDKDDEDLEGHFINWQNGKAIDVSGGKDVEGQAVIVWNKHNGSNQKW